MTDEKQRPVRQGAALSLMNGMRVLEAFSVEQPVLGVTEVAQITGLHKSTVSRVLNGFAEEGYVEKNPLTGRFSLGLGLIKLASPLLTDLGLRRVSYPFMQELMQVTGESVSVLVWNRNESVVVEQVSSPKMVKHTSAIGASFQYIESATVRAFLAEFTNEEIDARFESGVIRSKHGEIRLDEIIALLEPVRRDGISVNDGDTFEDDYSVASVIRDYRGDVVGCLCCAAPRSRVNRLESESQMQALVKSTALNISQRLGGR
ncbi:IclR family transcriptional regulator [Leucobacter sp. GX24907]